MQKNFQNTFFHAEGPERETPRSCEIALIHY